MIMAKFPTVDQCTSDGREKHTVYEVTFLNKLPAELTCGAGKSSHEVVNYIQSVIVANLSYAYTGFTRKDKYWALAGNYGTVTKKPLLHLSKVMGY